MKFPARPQPNLFFRMPDRSLTAYCEPEAFARTAPLHLYYGPRLLRGAPGLEFDAVIAAKLEHEIDHLHRALGTSYGCSIHRLHSAQIDSFFRYVAGRASGESLALPFVLNSSDGELQRLRACERLSERLICSRPPREIDSAAAQRIATLLPGVRPSIEPSAQSPGGDYAVPFGEYTLGGAFRKAAFGGYALLEFLGLSREIELGSMACLPGAKDAEFIKAIGYQLAGQIWKQSVRAATAEGRLPSEMHCACELALWIPIGPDGPIPSANRDLGWKDVHPGWRFLRIAEFLQNRTTTPCNAPLDEAYGRWFEDLESEICDAFDWPTPCVIAESWSDYLQRGLANGTFDKRFLEDDSERARGSLEILGKRIATPALAAHEYRSADNNPELWFSVYTVFETGGGKSRILVMDTEGRDFRALGYRFPPSISLTTALQLLVNKKSEALSGPELLSRFQLEGAGAVRDVSVYAKRHYGFGIEFGRDSQH